VNSRMSNSCFGPDQVQFELIMITDSFIGCFWCSARMLCCWDAAVMLLWCGPACIR
jgi:hypothetical protein